MTSPSTVGTIQPQNWPPSTVVSLATAPYFADIDAITTRFFSISGLPSGTGLSINSATGQISGTPTAADLTASFTATVRCADANNASIFTTTTISFIVSTPPSAAQNFYVNGANGNDAWTGSSATWTSGTTGPWATISRANTVQPHASGHVDIWIAPGTYRNQMYVPQYSGTDDTHRIRLRVTSDGIVDVMGPTSGHMPMAVVIGDGFEVLGQGSYFVRNYISILRESETRYFRFDGEVIFGTGGASKGDDISQFGHLENLGHVNGNGVVIEGAVRRTVGWSGLSFGPDVNNFVCRLDWEQHGTTHMNDGQDFGDCLWIDQSIPVGS